METKMLSTKFGGELQSLKINDVEKLHQGQNCLNKNGKIFWKNHTPVLFPIVGRLKEDKTSINGISHFISKNGFAKDMDFDPITKLENFHSYILKSNLKTKINYPFDFELCTTYRTDENKLTTMYRVTNYSGRNMPFTIGAQPAYKIDAEELKKGNYYLEFEKEEKQLHFLYLIEGLIGIEYAKDRVLIDKKRVQLDESICFEDAIIMKGIKSEKVSLKHKENDKTILTMDFAGFKYLSVWSLKNAPFICIAPSYATADLSRTTGVFVKNPDCIEIKPRESFECKFSVEFFEN